MFFHRPLLRLAKFANLSAFNVIYLNLHIKLIKLTYSALIRQLTVCNFR